MVLIADHFLYVQPHRDIHCTRLHGYKICLCSESESHPHAPPIALAAYEHISTTCDEYTLFFKRKWTGSTWIFALNRYLLLILVIYNSSPVTPTVSTTISYDHVKYICINKISRCTICVSAGGVFTHSFEEQVPARNHCLLPHYCNVRAASLDQ